MIVVAGHDCSIRLWNLDNKTCVQEITAHRKKFDESIFDVAFHPSRPYIASAGADALAKVFVWNYWGKEREARIKRERCQQGGGRGATNADCYVVSGESHSREQLWLLITEAV